MTNGNVRNAQTRKSVDRLCEHTYLPSLLNTDSVVLDLGANQGQFCHGIISRYQCHVFAFEPIPKLRASIQPLPGLTLLPFAIGGRNGRAKMHVFSNRCGSLLHEKDSDSIESEEDIEVIDLRSVLSRLQLDKIDLLKVDIEGSEIEMFASASDEDLRKFGQLTVEFHDFLYTEQHPQVESIKRRFRSLGFLVINFSLDNTDVLFVNTAVNDLGRFKYVWLKYITKYAKGIPRRLAGWKRAFHVS